MMPLNWHHNLPQLDTNGADRLEKKYVQLAAKLADFPRVSMALDLGSWKEVCVDCSGTLALASRTNQQFSVSSFSSLEKQRDDEMISSFIPGLFLIVYAISCVCQ